MRKCISFVVRSVRSLFYDIGREGVVAGDADGVTSQRVAMPLRRMAAGDAEVAQCGEEDLTIVGWHQVVEDWIDRRADIEQDVGQHVEIVVEVIQVTVGKQKTESYCC